MTPPPRVLSRDLRFPCCGGAVKFKTLEISRRTCKVCKTSYRITFTSAEVGERMGRELWRATWSSDERVVTG